MAPRYNADELDRAYDDGREDLAWKLVELLRQYEYEIPNDEIEAFLEAELGFEPTGPSVDEFLTDTANG